MYNTSIYILMLLTAWLSCMQRPKLTESPNGYNLNEAEKFNMPGSLTEISGICFKNGNPDTVFAVQDEEGKLFRLAWGERQQWNTKFARNGDYEDVAIMHGRVYVLQSDGDLYSFTEEDASFDEVKNVLQWKKLLPKGEFEGLFADGLQQMLYVLCKDCKTDDGKNQLTGYTIDLKNGKPVVASFVIDVDEIKEHNGKLRHGFKPSAMAKNPATGEWYILSAVNKMLVVADSNWLVSQTFYLHGNTFNQPEGIAFDKEANLYISNEGDEITSGNILKFKRSL